VSVVSASSVGGFFDLSSQLRCGVKIHPYIPSSNNLPPDNIVPSTLKETF
jgi:hypothetical protein